MHARFSISGLLIWIFIIASAEIGWTQGPPPFTAAPPWTFYSDGVNPVNFDAVGRPDGVEPLDGDPWAVPTQPNDPTGIVSLNGPGFLVYPTGYPVPTNIVGLNQPGNRTGAVAGPIWPPEWRNANGLHPGASINAHVVLPVLPAGNYYVFPAFSSVAQLAGGTGNTFTAMVLFVDSISIHGATLSLPSVSISAPDAYAVEGTNDKARVQFTRTGGDNTKVLGVKCAVGTSGDPQGSAAFYDSDYTLLYSSDGGGGAISPGGDGKFTVNIPANASSIRVVVKAKQTAQHPEAPNRPVVFQLLPDPTYSVAH